MDKLVENCFDNIDEFGIYVIGNDKCLDEFLCTYFHDYNIVNVYSDNNELIDKIICGFKIQNINKIEKNKNCKYIICGKNNDYLDFLKNHSIENIGIYLNDHIYPGRQKYMPGKNGIKDHQMYKNELQPISTNKKYNIGYIAGVFDLYHIGHLNLFKRAKDMCNYLIVGVVSDKGVIEKKKTNLVIPFDERIELVRSCKYVDEAVEIPYEYCRTDHAFRKYHFDVQFSGSDYENNKGWLGMREFLRKNGSDMVFIPYTKERSSTKIKNSLIKK